jgi:hypothetical protein
MAQGAGQINYGVQQLIVAGCGNRKLGTDGRFLGPRVMPPLAFEVQNLQVALAQPGVFRDFPRCGGPGRDSLPARILRNGL